MLPLCSRRREAAAAVMALDQSTLEVTGLAIGEVGWLEEGADAVLGAPAQGAVVGDVAEEQACVVAKPHRPFQPAEALG